jgi:glycosyltransferase involved in cell wall biosynthesis
VHLVLYGLKREVFYEVSTEVHIHKPSFEFDNSKRLFHTFKTIAFLRKTIRAIHPISVLSFGETWNNMVLLSLLGTKIPIYVSDRAQPDKSLGKIHDFLRKKLYPRANGVIVQTQKGLEVFKKMYAHSNFKVIGNPIRSIAERQLKREKVILMVGRYIQLKQQDVLIRIFANLNAEDWKLVLVGYDHLKQSNQKEWEELAKKLRIEDRVVFTGKQEDVEKYYLTSSIFAFTSASEGFPNVIGEAMAAGLPVVVYDCVAGPSDLVISGETGYLIPLNDEIQFTQKLQYLIDFPAEREKMGRKGKEFISTFELIDICKQFEQFIVPNTER